MFKGNKVKSLTLKIFFFSLLTSPVKLLYTYLIYVFSPEEEYKFFESFLSWAPFISCDFWHVACPCCWNVVPAPTNSSLAWQVDVYLTGDHRICMSEVQYPQGQCVHLLNFQMSEKPLLLLRLQSFYSLEGKFVSAVYWQVRAWGHVYRWDTQGRWEILVEHFKSEYNNASVDILSIEHLVRLLMFSSLFDMVLKCLSVRKMQFNQVQQSSTTKCEKALGTECFF